MHHECGLCDYIIGEWLLRKRKGHHVNTMHQGDKRSSAQHIQSEEQPGGCWICVRLVPARERARAASGRHLSAAAASHPSSQRALHAQRNHSLAAQQPSLDPMHAARTA